MTGTRLLRQALGPRGAVLEESDGEGKRERRERGVAQLCHGMRVPWGLAGSTWLGRLSRSCLLADGDCLCRFSACP